MKRLTIALVLVAAALALASPAGAAAEPVQVRVEPTAVDTVIGTQTLLGVEISNVGAEPTGPLVAHLVVVDPKGGGSADAEDWTSALNRPLPGLAPGATTTIEWDVAPIMAGDYRVLVSVVPIDGGPPAVSTQVRFAVSQPDALVSGATLPVAVTVPLLLVGAALLIRRIERNATVRLS